ncbi:polysaccharide biosynthesis tyrosine autokinase [Pseudarthrobacter sp. J75]|nr:MULTISPECIES: polysaccharide biosynthesis tyrosine autokinase [unclassified Pseudarthrobacter]MEE2522136.1 polysaccharide biosynthesis tyrosine autokinase [Pseudarthrobacter sp. J47]MEE2528218.1 polysaccharide biosynthesis tyrosine autokinase [Pseudarthrobacter sp. J75]
MALTDYLRVVRVHWKAIVATTLSATLLAFGWTFLQPRIYASESSGIVVAGGSENLSLSLAGDSLAKSKAKNYKSVASSRLVADRVIADLGLDTTADQILNAVTISVPLDTAELKVTATSTDPENARRIADGWVRALAAQVNELEGTVASESQPAAAPSVSVVPLGTAVLPTSPVSPNVKTVLLFGAALGLLMGMAYALLRNHLDRRLRSAAEIERLFGVPVIGTLPVDHRLDGKSKVLDGSAAGSIAAESGSHAITEALRELRTNLQFIDVDNPPRIIVVTSSVSAEGKSTVTANLAATMAAAGEKVVVIDGDLRRPTVVNVFNLVPGVGVTDVLSGQAEVEDVLQQWGNVPNLQVLGSGRIPPNPSELLGSHAMQTMLRTLARDATVLIDAPPLLPVTDAAVLSRAADGAIVVVNAGKTTQDELGKALDNMRKAKGHILGTILNRVPTSGADSYSYYGSYGSLAEVEEPVQLHADSEFDRLLSDTLPPQPSTFAPTRSRRSTR